MPLQIDYRSDGVAEVVLDNRARRNALDLELLQNLAAAWPELDRAKSIRAIVISGAAGTFCSGADLSADLQSQPGIDELVDCALLKTHAIGKPIIAAIVGSCVAGGLELALAADLRIAAHDAKLGFPEVKWGIMPSGGGSMKLADQIGFTRAMDLLLTGRLIDGVFAEQIGLVSETCPVAQVRERALQRASEIATNSPVAIQATKQAVLAHRLAAYREREPFERALVKRVRDSGHAKIGIAAFRAKQRPFYDET